MASNALVVPMGAMNIGTISDNNGVVISDASGHVKVIGLSPVCIDIDLILKSDQALRRITFFNILASRISQICSIL